MLRNTEIREAASARGVKLWQIAEGLGITDGNFSRKLRRELPPEDKEKVLKIIDRISCGKGGLTHGKASL